MRLNCALLCDAATVRDGLLHILGGGIAKAARGGTPEPIGVALAIAVSATGAELAKSPVLTVRVLDPDQEEVLSLRARLLDVLGDGGDVPAFADEGEGVVPLAITWPQDIAQKPGTYNFEILLDNKREVTLPLEVEVLASPTDGEASGEAGDSTPSPA